MKHGDIIVLATDGILDNLTEKTEHSMGNDVCDKIACVVQSTMNSGGSSDSCALDGVDNIVDNIAEAIMDLARDAGKKEDDMTVVVAYIALP